MKKQLLLSITVLLNCTNLFAQAMPINRFSYSKASKSGNYAPNRNDCISDWPSLKSTYISSDGLNIDAKLDEYIINFQDRLKDIDNKVPPAFAICDAKVLADIIVDVEEAKTRNLKYIADHYDPSSSVVEVRDKKIKKFNSLLKDLNELKLSYEAINKIAGSPKIAARCFPSNNRFKSSLLYQQYGGDYFQVGNQISIYGWENKGVVNPEIISFFAGPFRIGVNTLITSSNDTNKTDEAKLRTLTGSGGNAVLSFYYPLFHTKLEYFNTLIQFSPKAATEIPVLGSPFSGDTMFANFNIGIDWSMSIRLPIFGGSSLYFYTRPTYIIGTKEYLNALKRNDNFYLVQSTLGLDLPKLGKIGFGLPNITDAKELKVNTFLFSLQISPQVF